MSFESTTEYKQMMKMRPACTKVLCDVFNLDSVDCIERFDKDDNFILDKKFHIDLKVTLKNNMIITGQEKALTNQFYKYKTFTMEFYQNRHERDVPLGGGKFMRAKETGEFFNIASQFYLTGYSDKTGVNFIEWKIIDLLRFNIWLSQKMPFEEIVKNTRSCTKSNGSFFYINYDEIPPNCVIANGP